MVGLTASRFRKRARGEGSFRWRTVWLFSREPDDPAPTSRLRRLPVHALAVRPSVQQAKISNRRLARRDTHVEQGSPAI